MFGGANGAAAIKILPTLDEFERVRKHFIQITSFLFIGSTMVLEPFLNSVTNE
jgi:hypothetical protein